jgi:ABC-type uncharacterized transport system permease subunit
VALFFAVITSGSIQLPLALSIDSSISGVLQGLIVLAIIVVRARRGRNLHELDATTHQYGAIIAVSAPLIIATMGIISLSALG